MRISDWSSDVCSSDLGNVNLRAALCQNCSGNPRRKTVCPARVWRRSDAHAGRLCQGQHQRPEPRAPRSEEHTSELQSLMRISYAVFCLKKKKYTNNHTNNNINKSRTSQYKAHNNK